MAKGFGPVLNCIIGKHKEKLNEKLRLKHFLKKIILNPNSVKDNQIFKKSDSDIQDNGDDDETFGQPALGHRNITYDRDKINYPLRKSLKKEGSGLIQMRDLRKLSGTRLSDQTNRAAASAFSDVVVLKLNI